VFFNDGIKLGGVDRFGQIVVHPRSKALFPVTLHGMSGHGNDRDMLACSLFPLTDPARGFQTVEQRHLNIHQDHVKVLPVEGFERFPAVACDQYLMAAPFEHSHCDPLIDQVVFGDQDAQGPRSSRRCRRWQVAEGMARNEELVDEVFRLCSQHISDGIQQIRLFDGLGEVSRDSDFATAGGIAAPPGRRQHDDL